MTTKKRKKTAQVPKKRGTRGVAHSKLANPSRIGAALATIDRARGTTKPTGATEADLRRLRGKVTLHADHEAVLRVHNGGLHLDSYDLLDTKSVARWQAATRPFGATLVPFAADSGGNLWCVGARGRVVAVERQGPSGRFGKAASIRALLEDVVARLTDGTLIADEQGNIVEPILEPAVPEKATEPNRRIEPPLADEVKEVVEVGDVKKLAALLDAGRVHVDSRFWWDQSLIACAAEARQRGVVELLLSRGCPVDDGKAGGLRTALFSACWGTAPALELVELLLSKGADPNAMTGYDGTPLHAAVMWEHADALALLRKAGGDPNAKTAKGQTALDAVKRVKGAKRAALLAALA